MTKEKCNCGCSKKKDELKEAAIKKAKEAVDAYYTLYELAKKDKTNFNEAFLKELDEAFEGSNKVLSKLISQ